MHVVRVVTRALVSLRIGEVILEKSLINVRNVESPFLIAHLLLNTTGLTLAGSSVSVENMRKPSNNTHSAVNTW